MAAVNYDWCSEQDLLHIEEANRGAPRAIVGN